MKDQLLSDTIPVSDRDLNEPVVRKRLLTRPRVRIIKSYWIRSFDFVEISLAVKFYIKKESNSLISISSSYFLIFNLR